MYRPHAPGAISGASLWPFAQAEGVCGKPAAGSANWLMIACVCLTGVPVPVPALSTPTQEAVILVLRLTIQRVEQSMVVSSCAANHLSFSLSMPHNSPRRQQPEDAAALHKPNSLITVLEHRGASPSCRGQRHRQQCKSMPAALL